MSPFYAKASIYFEKVIKAAGSKLTIWDRNFQLAFHSILLFVAMVAYETLTTGVQPGNGWTWLSMAVAVLGALGGVLVALSVNYFETLAIKMISLDKSPTWKLECRISHQSVFKNVFNCIVRLCTKN